MTAPDPLSSPRRAARAAAERARGRRRLAVGVAVVVLLVAGAVGVARMSAGARGGEAASAPEGGAVIAAEEAAPTGVDAASEAVPAAAQLVDGLPVPSLTQAPVTAPAAGLCDDPAVATALARGDDGAVIAAAGGGAAFRAAVAGGQAPCIALDDPARTWVVINKLRPFNPVDYRPADLVLPEVRTLVDGGLRVEAAAALAALTGAAADAGAGEIASSSAFRSYATQRTTYAGHVSTRGVAGADLVSARPGFSEHQSGFTLDVVGCDGGCGSIDDVAGSPQGAWVAENAWRYGWIVRYEEGRTAVTGYVAEPWHLRYIGPELARAYREGGFTTLEEFFGLPGAPDYGG